MIECIFYHEIVSTRDDGRSTIDRLTILTCSKKGMNATKGQQVERCGHTIIIIHSLSMCVCVSFKDVKPHVYDRMAVSFAPVKHRCTHTHTRLCLPLGADAVLSVDRNEPSRPVSFLPVDIRVNIMRHDNTRYRNVSTHELYHVHTQ